MQRLALRLTVAVLTFTAGLSAYAGWTVLLLPSNPAEQLASVSKLREDQLHRIYEAALMTGGHSDLREFVLNKLMCTNNDGVSDAEFIHRQDMLACERAGGLVFEVRPDIGPYGPMLFKIRSEHHAWSLENLGFIRELTTADKADRYVTQHMTDLIADDSLPGTK